MKKTKWTAYILVCVMMLGMLCPVSSVKVWAEDTEYSSEDGMYQYRIVDAATNSIMITGAGIKEPLVVDEEDGVGVLNIPAVIDEKYKVIAIGKGAFEGMLDVKKIVIPDGVISLGNYCFYDDQDVEEIVIPDTVEWIGERAFSYTKWLINQRQVRDDHLVIVNDILVDGRLCTGAVVIPTGVTRINQSAFFGPLTYDLYTEPLFSASTITSITIPSTVTSIGKYAFQSNHQLETVSFVKGLKLIEDQAFVDCQALKSIKLPASVETIGAGAFFQCTSMTKADISKCLLEALPLSCFNKCSSLTELKLPETLKKMDRLVFANCPNLKELVLPAGLQALGKGVFDGTTEISVTIPETISDLSGFTNAPGTGATFHVCAGSAAETFMRENQLAYVTYGDAPPATETTEATTAGTEATTTEASSTEMEATTTEASSTEMETTTEAEEELELEEDPDSLIGECYTKNKVVYEVTSADAVCVTGVSTKKLLTAKLPDTIKLQGRLYQVTAIRKGAFSGCKKLKTVVIGKYVKAIGDQAFKNCTALTRITIGSRVETIGKYAFQNNRKLRKLVINSKKLKTIGRHAFDGVNASVKILVPAGKGKAYKKLIQKARTKNK